MTDSVGALPDLELSILMPCLNEAETVGVCVDKANAFLARSGGVRGEVLIADGGSTDATRELAAARGARIVDVKERGYGAALRGGIQAARGRYIIMGDADDSYDFAQLDGFLERLRDGNDLVIGNRFRGGIGAGAMPFLHRYLGNPVLSLIGRLFFHTHVKDFHCGLRGFDRARMQALDLRTSGMEFASEMVVASALNNYRIAEVAISLKKDGRSRPPHLQTWRDGWRHLQFLLIYSPRWLFVYPGAAILLFGLMVSGLLLPGPLRISQQVVLDIHTLIIASMAILVGVQCIGFGLVARRFAASYQLLPDSALLAYLTPRRLIIVAGGMTVSGLAGVVWAVAIWVHTGFGALTEPIVARVLVLSSAGIASGVQLAFLTFLSHVIDLPLVRQRAKAAENAISGD